MRALAMTGIDTASWISTILVGSDMRATPPSARMSAGTRSSAITAAAPASSAIFACSAVTTSMMTPPLSISASPALTRNVPVSIGAKEDNRPVSRALRPGPAGGVAGRRAADVDHPPADLQELRDLAAHGGLRLDHQIVRVDADRRRRVRDRGRRRAQRPARPQRADVPDHQGGVTVEGEFADRRDAVVGPQVGVAAGIG